MKTDSEYPERIALIILSTIFFIGAVLLHLKHLRTCHDVTIVRNGIKQEFTLKEVERILTEKRKVPVNTAAAEEFTAIAGIGEKTAEKIVEYRSLHGPFLSPDDLLNVRGIGPSKLEKIRPFLKIE